MQIIYANSIDPIYPKDYERDYLNPFFPNQTCFLFTDSNINRFPDIDTVLTAAGKLDFILIDLTHNAVGLTHNQLNTKCKGNSIGNIEQLVEYCELYAPTVAIHCDFNYQSNTKNYFYFPLWLWMWSEKKSLWYKINCPDIEAIEYLAGCEEVERLSIYEDIPIQERVFEIEIERNDQMKVGEKKAS